MGRALLLVLQPPPTHPLCWRTCALRNYESPILLLLFAIPHPPAD
jgi:hypothetical protein